MPSTLTTACLSEQDRHVLETIFNPLELTSTAAGLSQEMNCVVDCGAAELIDDDDEHHCNALITKSRTFEVEGVNLAEQRKLSAALSKFVEALDLTPDRASIHNNRAQAYRLAGDDDAAFSDLNKAIELCTVKQRRTLCHALCQRGVLHRKRDHLEEARADFEAAAELGSKFAKTQLVEINPYAALCNQMLRQAFAQLK